MERRFKKGLANLVPLDKGQVPTTPWSREVDVTVRAGISRFEHKPSKVVRADFLLVLAAAPGTMVNVTWPEQRGFRDAAFLETGEVEAERLITGGALESAYLPLATMTPGQRIVLVVKSPVQARFACVLKGVQYI